MDIGIDNLIMVQLKGLCYYHGDNWKAFEKDCVGCIFALCFVGGQSIQGASYQVSDTTSLADSGALHDGSNVE